MGVYATALGSAVVALAAVLVLRGEALNAPLPMIFVLGVAAPVTERQPVRISPNAETTVSVLPILIAAIAYGPLAGMAVAALGLIVDCRPPVSRWLIWTSLPSLAGGFGGIAGEAIGTSRGSLGLLIAAVLAAATAEAIVDACIGGGVVVVRRQGRGCPARRGFGRRSGCDGQAVTSIDASLVGVGAASR